MTNTILINSQNLNGLINANLFIEDFNNQLIYISELTDFFGLGYNSFLVDVKQNTFQIGSFLHIFFADKNGVMIPVTITEYYQKSMIRCYVKINQQHPVGFGTLVIAGTLAKYKNNIVPQNWQNKINIKFQKKIYVNPHEKTPSVLRFKNKPNISTYIDQKRLYKQDIITKNEILKISNISIQKQHNNFICLDIDTSSNSNSVYYEKFLNYQIVSDITEVTDYNKIFYGSIEIEDIPYLGNFYGSLTSSNSNSILGCGNVIITDGILSIGNIQNSSISLLEGKGLKELTIQEYLLTSKTALKKPYSLYIENKNFINIENLHFASTQSKIKQIEYVSKIERANNISLITHYFSGSVNINGQFYSEELEIFSNGFEIDGRYKDLQIKRPQAFPLFPLEENIKYNNISITSSIVTISATGKTILTNCDIQNAYIGHKLSNNITTFDYLEGILYSTNLINIMQFDETGNSYFSGSIRGIGNFIVKTNGSKLILDNYNTRSYNSGSFIKLENAYIFQGQGYNSNIQISWFSGSIYSSSIMDKQYYINFYNSDIVYSKMLLESENFTIKAKSIETFSVKIPNGITTFPIFQLIPGQSINNSYIKIKSQTPFTVSLKDNRYQLEGYFNLSKGEAQHSKFIGYYQFSNVFYQIESYQLVDCILSTQYQKIFGTKEIHIFNNNYSKIYIPIALEFNKGGNDLNFLRKYITSSTDTESLQVEIIYNYVNSLAQPTLLKVSDIMPLYITIEDVDIYSGYFNGLEILYNNSSNNSAYQLLSNVELPENISFPFMRSLDLPILNFSGQTTNLLFKPKDALGRYSPEEFFHHEYNLNLKTLIDFQQTNIIYNENISENTSLVTSVNNMVGNVQLTAYNIPYFQQTEEIQTYNLGNLIDTYYNDWQYDAGVLNAPNIETTSEGELLLGPGQYLVYQNSNHIPPLYRFSIPNIIDFTPIGYTNSRGLDDKTTTYIKFSFQKGLYSDTNVNQINISNIIPVLTVYRDNTDIKYLDWFKTAKGIPQKLTQRFIKTKRFQVQLGGLILSESQSEYQEPPFITSTNGYVWYGTKRIYLDSINSNYDQTYLWYLRDVDWMYQLTNTYNNIYYNDSSGLIQLAPNKFTINWIYRLIGENEKYTAIILGTNQYNTAQQAQAQKNIPEIPSLLRMQGILIGRSIIQKGAKSSSIIQSAFDMIYGGSSMGGGINYIFVHPYDGIQAVVNDPSSTPHITLSLGTITPDNIKTEGYISGSIITSSIITSSNLIINNLSVLNINGTASSQFGNSTVQYRYEFQPSQQFLVGENYSKIITWSIQPTYKEISEQYYTLSYANYPDEIEWQQYETGVLNNDIRSITIPYCDKSTRLEIVTYDRGYPSYGRYGYIYARNYIYLFSYGKTLEREGQDWIPQILNDSETLKWLAKEYIAIKQINSKKEGYIQLAMPLYMINSNQPTFVINNIAGGFTKSGIFHCENNAGFYEQYVLYRSFNHSLGNTILSIT